jgi:iron(III) transport system substrate-binding protein
LAVAAMLATTGSVRAADEWGVEWRRTLDAAKKEGKVVVTAPAPGTVPRDAVLAFQKSHPDIGLEVVPWSGEADQKNYAEQKAGIHTLDVRLGGYTTLPGAARETRDMGAYRPIRELLILPEVKDEKVWRGGWDARFMDRDKKYVFAFQDELVYQAYVNREFVPASELKDMTQLTDPKWNGKISILDPSVGFLVATAGHLMLANGEDYLRKLYANGLAVSSVPRQQVEWLIRGRYPIGIAIHPLILVGFQKGGLGKNVEPLGVDTPAGARVSPGYGTVMVMAKAPHPNAAMVFLNWLLSIDGQTTWSKIVEKYMARLDVPGPAQAVTSGRVDPKKEYLRPIHLEEYGAMQMKAQELYEKIVVKR